MLSLETDAPTPVDNAPEAGHEDDHAGWRDLRVFRQDYFAREAANRSLGDAGEALVVTFEQERLSRAGHERLAGQVEHVAKSRGDGLGFDVLSFETSGVERLIEVKTTRFGKLTPFFVTPNEVSVSSREAARYQLYRLYRFGDAERGRLFRLEGAFEDRCSLDPTVYRATIRPVA